MSARNVPPPPKRAMSFFAHRKQQQQQQQGLIHNLKSSSQQQSSSSSSLDSPSPLLPQESSNASRQGKRRQRAPRTRQRDNESLHASSLSDDDDDEEEYHREKEEEESSGHDDNFNAKDYHSKRTKHKNSPPLSCLEDDREQQRTAQEAAVASAATTLPDGRGKSNRPPSSPRTIDTGTGGSDASAVKKPSVSLSLAQTPQSPAAVLLSKHAVHHSSAHALDNDTNDTTSTNSNSSNNNNNKVMLSASAQTALAEAICATIESAAAQASANHDGGCDDGRDGADDHNFRNDAMAVVVVPPEHLAKAMAAGWPKHVVQSAARVACEREREQAALSLALQRRTKRNGGTIGSTRRTTPRGRTAKRQGRPSLFSSSSSSSSDEEGMQNDWRQQQQQQRHHQSRRRHDHRHHRQSRKRARKEDSGDARQQQHDRACPRKTGNKHHGNRRSSESSRRHIRDHVAQASRLGQQQQQSPPTELSAVSHVLTDSIYRYTLETSLSRGELRQLSEWDHAVQKQVHAENSLVLENVELVAEEKRSSRQVEHIRDELVILRMSTLRVRGEAEQLEKKLSQIDEGCRSRKGASRFLAALETIGKVCREEQSEQTSHENK